MVPQAGVVLTNLATGVSQRLMINKGGIYLIPTIEPGQYRISVSFTGFKTFVQEPITIPVGGRVTL